MQDIKEYLSYDPLTGVFTRNINWNRWKAGTIAGSKNHWGYIDIKYENKTYKAHRLAWWFVHGVMPEFKIDHINEIKDDNRIANLRLDINGENPHNISIGRADNTSGYRGVSWYKPLNKWVANICVKGKAIYLGYYDTPEEAHEAYLCAKRTYHPFWVETKEELQ